MAQQGRTREKASGRQASPIHVAKALKGAHFPKQESELVEHARSAGQADDGAVRLQRLPDRQYENIADVERGVGESR